MTRVWKALRLSVSSLVPKRLHGSQDVDHDSKTRSASIDSGSYSESSGRCLRPRALFPVWLAFKGGKGVAASAGALFGLMPFVALIAVAVWLIIFYLTRYVSVASVTAALAVPITILSMMFLGQTGGTALLYFSICLAAVVIVRHRSNLSRLVRGTEPRFKRK